MLEEDLFEELESNEATLFKNPSYKDAIVGISTDGRAIYDYDKMIESLCSEENLSYIDSVEFINYNTIRSLPYIPKAPIIAYLNSNN